MASQALYNKWRGQTFDDILGQEHITRTLQNQIRAGRIGHAYLFTGLRGTGKTSTARILAKAVNCVGNTDHPPCNRCPICISITEGRSLDLIEIDAASNRGIDEIRDLRDGVNFSPHECRYKVHVIDEVHMLTNEAFNALLKTLEEPPPHVIFVLCTTEPHRLPDTILSRCQRFDFRRGSVDDVLSKLRRICESEDISISAQALDMIARRGGGSFRDAESLLDQLAAYGATEIGIALVQSVLGSVESAVVLGVVESLVSADAPRGLGLINQAIENGAEPRQFLSEILEHLRGLLLIRVGSGEGLYYLSHDAVAALNQLNAERTCPPSLLTRAIREFSGARQGLRNAPCPQLPLEVAFIETLLQDGHLPEPACPTAMTGTTQRRDAEPETVQDGQAAPYVPSSRPPSPETVHAGPADASAVETSIVASAPESAPRQPDHQTGETTSAPLPQVRANAEATTKAAAMSERSLGLDWVQARWTLILTKMRARNPQLRTLLDSVYPVGVSRDVANGQPTITLACEAPFHRDKLSDNERLHVLEEVAAQVLETRCAFACTVDPHGSRPTSADLDEAATRPGARDLFAGHDGSGSDTNREQPSREIESMPTATADSAATDSTQRSGESGSDLVSRIAEHPAVKRLRERGGKITRVVPVDSEKETD